jgi:hypothetical protein
LPRHQTLRTTLDWSYQLLHEPERVILRRLAIFCGAFRLEAAGAVAASRGLFVVIDAAIGRAERTKELWKLPEMMRAKGGVLLLQSTSRDQADAENCFRQALDV